MTLELKSYYTYPNEDICLFKNISSNLKICVLFPFYGYSKCTCTILWILENNKLNNSSSSIDDCNFFSILSCLKFDIKNCNFSARFEKCSPKSISSTKSYLPNIDKFYNAIFFDFIAIILIPIFSILGIITNLICVIVLVNDKNKNSPMRKLMLLNSSLNLIYCFIYLIHLVNKCAIITGIFCSSVNRTYQSQIFSIYVVKFFGSILKLTSNLTCMGISFIRLKELNNKRNYLELNLKKRILFLVCL